MQLSGGENDEKEFEPTIDMIMNDFDDEQTMEEEEALESQEDNDDEISALNEEQDMPLEELLKLYNYGGGAQAAPLTPPGPSKEKGKKKKRKHKEQAKSQKNDHEPSKIDDESGTQLKDVDKIDIEVCDEITERYFEVNPNINCLCQFYTFSSSHIYDFSLAGANR